MFGAAMALRVAVVAYGRAGWVPLFGMPDRYTLLSAPLLCAAYFVWLLYGTAPLRNYIANAFAVVAVLALPFNVREGVRLAGLLSVGNARLREGPLKQRLLA